MVAAEYRSGLVVLVAILIIMDPLALEPSTSDLTDSSHPPLWISLERAGQCEPLRASSASFVTQ